MENVNTELCKYDDTNIYKVEEGRQLIPQPYQPDYLETHYFFSPYLSFGDYDNSCNVERSNVRMWEEMFADSRGENWIKLTGAYGSESIAVKLSCTNTEIIETLQTLENYPAINDEDCNLVTMEMEEEALDNWILRDFKDKVIGHYEADDSEADDSEFRSLYFDMKEKTNTYEVVESGGNLWIDIERLTDGLPEEKPENLKLINY